MHMVLYVVAGGLPAKADSNGRREKMTVSIVALGSSVRTLFGGNQNSYVASVIDKSGHTQIVKVIDWFRATWSGRHQTWSWATRTESPEFGLLGAIPHQKDSSQCKRQIRLGRCWRTSL